MKIKNEKINERLIFKSNINIFIKVIFFWLIIDSINADGCFISNKTIIASQWLNNIICLGAENLRYINIATFSSGDMIVEATSSSDYSDRIFYGIKRNGDPFFTDGQYHSKITVSGETESNNARNEAEIFIVTIDNTEYLFSLGMGSNIYAELYDLNNQVILSKKLATSLLSTSKIYSVRGAASYLVVSGTNYIIFPFIDSSEDFYIKRIYFSSTNIESNSPTLKSYSVSSRGRVVSCFITGSNYIICLFLHISKAVWQYYHIGIYDTNLNKKKEIVTDYYSVDYTLGKEFNYFSKCIHLEENIGAFIFFKASGTVIHSVDTYPTIIFREVESATSLNEYLYEISLDKKTFNQGILLNDFIKISTTKLCFISASSSKDDLYIVLINIFNTNKIVLRYYTLNIFTKYTFKILSDMRLNLYNNYISFGFSFCRQESCDDNSDSHYAGLMIFSYPNGTDYSLNITKYIFDNNDSNNLSIDLKNHVRIDNNVFGLIYSKIIIKEIENCNNIGLISSINTDTNININYEMGKNEKIKLNFNSLNIFNCMISYIYQITEPDFTIYNNYAERYTDYGEDTADIFNNSKSTYESRKLYYYMLLEQNLVIECLDENCDLCPENRLDYCLVCRFDYTINNGAKICYPEFDPTEYAETLKDTIELSEEKINNNEESDTVIESTNNQKTEGIEQSESVTTTEKTNNQNNEEIEQSECDTKTINNQKIEETEQNESDTPIETTSNQNTEETEQSESDTTTETTSNQNTEEIEQSESDTTTETTSNQNTEEIEQSESDTTIEHTSNLNIEETGQKESDTTKETINDQNTEEIKQNESGTTTESINNEEIIQIIELEKECTNDQILNNECDNGKMANEQIKEIFNSIRDNILKEDYHGENKIIETENVVIQLSTLEDQKNGNNPNVSTIDIGQCENILKTRYNISDEQSLIVLKTDIKNEDLTSTYVQYEIYHPITKEQLDLTYCKDVTIIVSVPVNLDDNTVSLYDSLSESGYNLFDSEDDFYNDICSTYTSQNGTDMILSDRKKEIYSAVENISMCQTGCEFESYNKTTKKAKCNCEVQTNSIETDVSKIDFSAAAVASSFISTLKNSNFLVMKCYKLAIDITNLLKNKGRIIMTLIYFLYLIALVVYIIKDRNKIKTYINTILKSKVNDNNLSKDNINSKNEIINITQGKKNKKSEYLINKKKNKEKESKKMKNISNKNNKLNKEKNKDNKKHKDIKKIKDDKNEKNKKNKKSKFFPNQKNKKNIIKKQINITKDPPKKTKKNKNSISGTLELINSTTKRINTSSALSQSKKSQNKININIIPIQNINYGKLKKKEKNENGKTITNYKPQIKTEKTVNIFKNNHKKDRNSFKIKDLNDQELNTLEYKMAVNIDKRTYLQFYWSLLKKKQLILFAVLPANDYNIRSLKILLFLISFSLYFTINGFFFSDDTMHKIHEDSGEFNIIFQIPQILYSSIVSAAINMILKLLSLSEKNILSIKKEKDLKIATKASKNIRTCITIKFIIFFILSNILLLLFWYFISCFCAVYTNTQMILIEDTLISFGLSLLYPFGLNLLPGMLRIPALRSKNKDKKLLYQISCLVALI